MAVTCMSPSRRSLPTFASVSKAPLRSATFRKYPAFRLLASKVETKEKNTCLIPTTTMRYLPLFINLPHFGTALSPNVIPFPCLPPHHILTQFFIFQLVPVDQFILSLKLRSMSQYGGENNPHFRPRERPDPTLSQHIPPEPLQPWDYHPTQIPQSDRIHPRPRLQTQTTIPVTQPPMTSPEHNHQEPPPPMVRLRPSEHHTRSQPPTPPRQHQSRRHSRPVDTPPVLQPTRHSRPVDPSIPRPTRHSRPEDAQPVHLPNRHARPIDPPPGPHSARHSRLADAHVPQEHQQGPRPLRQSGPHGRQQENLMYPEPGRTKPITWCGAVFCVILWLVIILGGLLVLIVYLVYRPRTPHFEISNASLNAVYLDMGYLLNADLRVLVNFTNPNKKVHVDFSYVILQLYFEKQLIANQYIEPFSASSAENKLADVEIVSSQVRVPIAVRQKLVAQMQRNRITFELDGIFHARSNFGSLLRYSYWLYGHCKIEMTGPPSGIIISNKCYTKD